MHTGQKAHFVGIAGVGMSALAQMMAHEGVEVTGSDNVRFPTLDAVERLGIPVVIGYDAKNIPIDADVVIYTDAAREDNPERVRARELGIRECSYFEMLGEVSKDKRTVAVAGTHGKTTTTSMLARILIDAGASPTVVVGSIVKDFGSNFVPGKMWDLVGPTSDVGPTRSHREDVFVVEACEYRDHLLELSPEVLVLNNLEWDHTDWFPSLATVQATFQKAIDRVPETGVIVTDVHNPNIAPLLRGAKARIVDYTQEPAYELHLLGEFNENNARAAAAAARIVLPSITDESIAASLATFQGTWRRFEYKGKNKNGAAVYDDYAHHPTAVRETIQALRAKTSGRIFVAFHPHLYSRTRDLLGEFATAFAGATQVYLAPIYAAREVDDGSISSEVLAERVRATGVAATALPSLEAIESALEAAEAGDTVVTMGAGDIYTVADRLVA